MFKKAVWAQHVFEKGTEESENDGANQGQLEGMEVNSVDNEESDESLETGE